MGALSRRGVARAGHGAGLLCAVILAAALVPGRAQAARGYGVDAVQNRHYTGTHEFSLHLGVLPMDAFTKGVTASGAYTLRFTDLVGWEVAHFGWSFHVDSGLRDDLESFDLRPTPFEVIDYYLTSNFVLTPVYWKGVGPGDGLLRGEFFVLAGGGFGRFTRSTRPAFDAGLGARLFFSRHWSARLDARHHVFFQSVDGSLDTTHELWVGLGVALTL